MLHKIGQQYFQYCFLPEFLKTSGVTPFDENCRTPSYGGTYQGLLENCLASVLCSSAITQIC